MLKSPLALRSDTARYYAAEGEYTVTTATNMGKAIVRKKDIVDEIKENDRKFEHHGVQIVCDPKSYLYLNGTEIDFEDSMMGGGFKFNNPNVKRSCGCGTSFSA